MTNKTIKETIKEKLVEFYTTPSKKIMLIKKEYDTIYKLFNSVGKNPKDFYKKNNKGRIQIENNSVVYLDADELGLDTLYPSIGNLKNLKWLFLSYNKIEKLPKEIGELKNLERLCLLGNKITEIQKEIGKLKNLKVLSLWNNPLSQKAKDVLEKLKDKGVSVWY